MKRRAAASVVLGALAVACGLMLVPIAAQGSHTWPSDRWRLWSEMWSARFVPSILILATAALALGWLGKREPEAAAARVGRVLAVVGLLLAAYPHVQRTERYVRDISPPWCLSNVKNIVLALNMYASDYDGLLAPTQWCERLNGYIKNPGVYHCPQARGTCNYAYNSALGQRRLSDIADPSKAIAIFDAEGHWDAHGGREILTGFPRHLGGDNIGFVDGAARWYARQRPPNGVRWNTAWPRELVDGGLQWQPVVRGRGSGRGVRQEEWLRR